ncbi:MAG: hypothetical protein AAFR17_02150 [Pseudomonadota bacterium]
MSEDLFRILSLTVQVIGFSSILISVRMVNRQIQSSVFCDYTKRFAEIFPDLSVFISETNMGMSFYDLPPDEQIELQIAMRKYLNLCAEEYHLVKSGYIAKSTWREWESLMREIFKSRLMTEAGQSVLHEFKYFHGFYEFIRKMI